MYTRIRPLGSGSFGKVECKTYTVAEHSITGIRVAIKYISKNVKNDKSFDDKVKREIKILQRFNHPHIIRL